MPADQVPLEDLAVARDRLRRDTAARSFQRPHSDIARLVIRCSQCPRATTAPAPVTRYLPGAASPRRPYFENRGPVQNGAIPNAGNRDA